MALVVYDRVQETTATTGTGTLTLGGAVAGYQSFAVVGNGNTTFYCIINGSQWEVGIGTYTSSGTTLARTTVLSNSNGNTSPITLVGASSVFCTYPAEKSINYDADGVATIGAPLSYSDTGVIASFASTVAGYNQVVIQNKSTATDASSNLNVSNDLGDASGNFAEFGINSSTFTGAGSFDIAGASYLASASTDLTIGTYGAYNIHFVTNSNTTDAMTIYDDGGISLGELANPGIGNIACNNINLKLQQIVTSGGTTTLTNASPYYTQFTGTSTHTVQLPDATTCLIGTTLILDNDSTQNVTIKNGAGTSFELLVPGGIHNVVLESNSTIAGTWIIYSSVPSTVEWGTNSLSLGSTVISGGTWQGGTIQPGYGGTGLTSFTSGGALYATSSSTLTSGTLPVTAGGTGQTSFSSGYIPYGNSSAALQSSALLQFNGSYLLVGGGGALGGATNPIAAFSQTANNYVQTYTYNPSNGTSASSDYVAYTDNSTDAHGWADLGYTSSTFADAVYTVTGPNEAYVFGSAPTGAGATGNLVYATDNTGSANAHQWYVGGFTQAKGAWKMQLTSTGLQLANALATTYGGTGLTSFTSGGALYATSTSALTTGTLPIAGGGTGISSYTAGDLTYFSTGTTLTKLPIGTSGQVLTSSGTAPQWSTLSSSAVTTLNFGTTGLTPATATSGAITVAGTLVAANGGTGQSSYAVGDLLYASTTTALSKLADVATGNALISGGVGVAPSYGKIGLTTHVSGTLPIANGGTNATATPTAGAVAYGTGTAYAFTAAGTTGQVLTSAGAGIPTWSTPATGSVTSVSGTGTVSGISLSGTVTTSGSLTLGGTLAVTPSNFSSQAANTFLAAPNGAAGVPTFRNIVAADVPTLNQNTTGSAATFTSTTQNSQFNSIGVGAAASGTAGRVTATTGVFTPNTAGVSTGLTVANGDITAYRTGGTTGVIYLSSSGSNYLYWDGGNYILNGGGLSVTNAVTASSFSGAGTGLTGTAASLTAGAATLAANTSSISSAVGNGYTWTGVQYFQNSAANNTGTGTSATLQAYSNGAGGAYMAFHRPGLYAINMGLDSDNVFRIGGWSASASCLQLTGGGALTTLAGITASSGNVAITSGNLTFGAANPLISASSYFTASGGAYFNSGTVYTEARIQARGGIGSDSTTNLTLAGGTSGNTIASGQMIANNGFQAESTGPFFINNNAVSANFTIPANYNAMSAGPITVNTGVTVTVSTGSTWVVV